MDSMSEGSEKKEPMRNWNVAILVKNYPTELVVQGPEFFIASVGEEFMRPFREFTKKKSRGEMFVGSLPAEHFMWFGLRVRCEEAVEAVVTARNRVEGFMDASVLTVENANIPEICDVVWLGLAGDPSMRLQDFHYDDWIHLIHGGNEGTAMWNERTNNLRERLILFYELAADTHSKAQSEVGIQLRHSLRMYRHGIATRCLGVEFICKFAALEGLVCGQIKKNKGPILLDRIGALFRSEPEAKVEVEKLWKYRSEAVHTAQAFDNGSLDQGAALAVHLDPLNRFFRTVVVFALDHLHEVKTVEELWAKAASYTPPPYAVMQRPKGMEGFVMKNMLIPLNVVVPNQGAQFEKLLERSRTMVAEHQAKQPAAKL